MRVIGLCGDDCCGVFICVGCCGVGFVMYLGFSEYVWLDIFGRNCICNY